MQFTLLPSDFAPLDAGAVYAFEAAEAGTYDFRIIDAASDELLGTKRFYATATGRFDIAPYLRDRIRYTLQTGSTGFVATEERSVTVTVETDGATTPARTFLPGPTAGAASGMMAGAAPEIRTSLPRVRLLAQGECEEITLLSTDPCTVTLVARGGDTTEGVTYHDTVGGLRLFRLNTADFPQAETLSLSFGALGDVEYRLVERPREAQRLAWAGRKGSVEHYTFPVERLREVVVTKERSGGRAVREVRTTLASAYEVPETAEALTEILSAPAVWLVGDEGGYTPVDVLTEQAVFRRHGALCCLEITIR